MKVSNNKETIDLKEKAAFSRSWIRLTLGLKGFTIQSFAEKHRVRSGTVAVVFSRPYPRMERLIANTLGLAPEDIWPSRYDENGKPNRPNLWYQRKHGAWKPKHSRENFKIKGKILGEGNGDQPK